MSTVISTVIDTIISSVISSVASGGGPKVQLYTPIFNGVNAYGELLATWMPSGGGSPDWEVQMDFYLSDATGVNRALIEAPVTGANRGKISRAANTNATWFDGVYDKLFLLNGVPIANSVVNIPAGYNTISAESDVAITGLKKISGNNTSTAQFWIGQIHAVRLIDNLDPSNSIHISTIIQSETEPTETGLYDSLHGDVKVGDLFNVGGYEVVQT